MDEKTATQAVGAAAEPRRPRAMKAFWKSVRRPLAQSRFVKNALASVLASVLRLIRLTNPFVEGSSNLEKAFKEMTPGIIALWHGQHLLTPTIYKSGARGIAAMVSRSADAEINALVLEKFGLEAVRGSGGRDNSNHSEKGGARALIALKRVLAAGRNVAMIADIPKGTPRQAGLGIVTLAKLSGRPIVAFAVATSRRKVLERSWDKTTINLPFGRGTVVIGDPIYVRSDADDAEMERKRQEVTASLNAATEKAYRLVDRA